MQLDYNLEAANPSVECHDSIIMNTRLGSGLKSPLVMFTLGQLSCLSSWWHFKSHARYLTLPFTIQRVRTADQSTSVICPS